MTNEDKVETQDVASGPIDDIETMPEQADAPEESQSPEKPVQDSAEDAEEAGEETTPQAKPVPFEEDAAPPAQSDNAAVEEEDALVEIEVAQEETVEAPDEQVSEPPEQRVMEAAPQGEPMEEQPTSDKRPATSDEQAAPTVESVIEAILFATDEPLTDSRIATIVETTSKHVRNSIKALNEKYEVNNNAFRIEQIAGGYQMLTLNVYNGWLKKMLHARSDSRLSSAALETLAIIAYKQPIIRADIEAIRGVAVGDGLRNLMYKGLVKITGRAEILGRPMLYGTTKKFLEVFGLNSLKDLPKAEELKKPD